MNGLHVDMDGFIEAVRVSCDAMAHPDLRSKALEHIAELEAAPATWIMCMDGLSNSYWETLESQFYSFKVIEKAVRHRYPSLTAEEQQALREFLMSYMRTHDLSQPALIRNKVAQIFALVFVQDYPGSWPTFFQDVIEHVSEQAPADLFLRILQAIDEQVAATEISRNAEEAEASAALKDAMREYDLSRIAQAWLTIITTFATPAPELAAHCLDVIATYILWIDVNLIVNQHFQQALHECVRVGSPVREAACRVIDAALTKGMPAAGRLAVVDELRVGDVLERICSDAELQADADLMTEVAAIVNTLLTTLIGGLAELAADSPEIAATHATVRRILPIALMLFGADDDGVSERVIHGINTYLHHLKQRSELGEAEAATFAVIADKALMKMQFDGEDEFENEEALALFLEFRVQLKSVLVNLSHIDLQRLLAVAAAVVSHLLSPSEDHPWQRVELGLHIVFVMQEIGAGVPLDDGEDSSEGAGHPMRSMLEQAVHYPVSHACPEPLLQQYFEVLGRASKFLARDVDRLMPALGTFFSAAGMQHPSSRLRSRCCYLLCTVLRDKSVRETATALIPEIVEHLLPYFHPSGMQEEQGRLNLLEAVSWLLAHHSISMEEKVYRIGQFVDPMVSAFSAKLEEAVHAPGTAAQQEQRCATLVYLINAVMRLSKGFSKLDEVSGAQDMHECFFRALSAFLDALAVPSIPSVHQAVRMFMHRMIVVLGRGVLADLPLAVSRLLESPSASDLEEFVPLVVHLIQKFRGDFAPLLQDFFLPFVQTVFAILSREVEANELDVQQQHRDLRRAYFTLIGAIVNAGLAHVFIADQNRGALDDVLMTLIQGASASPDDPKAIKSCFGSLRELTRQWFSEDGTCSVPEFEAFARQHLVQACFTTILQPSFDVNELQYYGALGEIALVLLLLTHAYGSEFLEYIRSEYLHQLLSPDLAQEFVAHIDQSAAVSLKAGKKRLSAFLKHFLLRMRSSSGSPPTAA